MSAVCEALYEAIDRRDHAAVKRLVAKSGMAGIELHPDYEETPLHRAIECSDEQSLRLLLELPKATLEVWLEVRDCNGITPIAAAVRKCNLAMFEALLEAGADIHCEADMDTGDSPLQWACFKCDVRIVNRLIDLGADVHQKDGQRANLGFYPLVDADASADIRRAADVLKILSDAGLDFSQSASNGNTVLSSVCAVDSIELFDIVVDSGCFSEIDVQSVLQASSPQKILANLSARNVQSVILSAMDAPADVAVVAKKSGLSL